MTKPFKQNLGKLRNARIAVAAHDVPDEEGSAAVAVNFSDGTRLQAQYWRLIQEGRALLSSFDHQKRYGLPAPVDAKKQLSSLLDGKLCHEVQFDGETADLTLVFGETTRLQIFNFTAYEIWQIQFPDGTGEYSNHALT